MICPTISFPECPPRKMAILRLTAVKSIAYTKIRNYTVREQSSINHYKQANILNESLAVIPLPRQAYKFVYNYPGRGAVNQPCHGTVDNTHVNEDAGKGAAKLSIIRQLLRC